MLKCGHRALDPQTQNLSHRQIDGVIPAHVSPTAAPGRTPLCQIAERGSRRRHLGGDRRTFHPRGAPLYWSRCLSSAVVFEWRREGPVARLLCPDSAVAVAGSEP
ncbi:hypothetical protein GJAV_G00101460 [Gymnothorax javanicus]|nr:hypothetical protein GJAV_G00101460 [Gymnothorax javanicus]